MGVLFWMLARTILFSMIGNSFYKWFSTTKTGKWFDKKLSDIMNKVTNKHEEAVNKKSQVDMFDNDKSSKS